MKKLLRYLIAFRWKTTEVCSYNLALSVPTPLPHIPLYEGSWILAITLILQVGKLRSRERERLPMGVSGRRT